MPTPALDDAYRLLGEVAKRLSELVPRGAATVNGRREIRALRKLMESAAGVIGAIGSDETGDVGGDRLDVDTNDDVDVDHGQDTDNSAESDEPTSGARIGFRLTRKRRHG
jgi:hypothetical protein